MKIILGAGGTQLDGWISTEKSQLDITNPLSFLKYFESNLADAFLAEHVWEHLSPGDGMTAAALCCRFLKPGGRLRIAVPDALHPDPAYVEWVRPGGNGPGGDDHRVLYDHLMLRTVLTAAGFARVIPLEWWDESGTFRAKPWKPEGGLIHRSMAHDARNKDGKPNYTSLIVDAIKSPLP